jgi:antiviral helicase SKI2
MNFACLDDSEPVDIADPNYEFPFTLDSFQKRGVSHIHNHESVFAAATTSAGKSVLAEYAIATSIIAGCKVIYTSPIKALSNQKFRDFSLKFGSSNIGIITGDVRVNADAPCLIMTTEILRAYLYQSDPILNNLLFAIFDEVHYINDSERGVVWEECLIMLPHNVKLVMLSATVPNFMQFADWVGRVRNCQIFCVTSEFRPVPLNFHVVIKDQRFHVGSSSGLKLEGLEDLYLFKDELESIKSKKVKNFMQKQRTEFQNMYHFLLDLWNEDLLPAAVFVFSRARLEKLAKNMTKLDLLNASEKFKVQVAFKKALASLSQTDMELPQIKFVMELASRGIGIHHGGLLPIIKELTEILFQKSLIKVLFATETIAIGLNLPTRTAIFSSIRKHDGGQFRYLLPTEFTQMSGRAGRRGMDTQGTVFMFFSETDQVPDRADLLGVLSKKSTELKSQFKITFEMLLHLRQINAGIRVEDMMNKSFLENIRSNLRPGLMKELEKLRAIEPDDLAPVVCSYCTDEQEMISYVEITKEIQTTANLIFPCLYGRKDIFKSGRMLVVTISGFPHKAVFMELHRGNQGSEQLLKVFVLAKQSVVNVPIQSLLWICDGVQMVFDQTTVSHAHEKWSTCAMIPKLSINHLEFFTELTQLVDSLTSIPVFQCEQSVSHLSSMKRVFSTSRRIKEIESALSEESLRLIPQRQAMEQVLMELGYLDDQLHLTVKGRVAVEVLNMDELTLIELLFENILNHQLNEAQIISVVCAFVAGNDSVADLVPSQASKSLPKEMTELFRRVDDQHRIVENVLRKHKVQTNWEEFARQICFGMSPVAYFWAKGESFTSIMGRDELIKPDKEKELQEGSIARVMVRTDELLRKLSTGCTSIGNQPMVDLIEKARTVIRRDIAFGMSLYIKTNEDEEDPLL